MSLLNLPDVTVCAIDSVTPQLASAALQRCTRACEFGRAVLLTDVAIDTPHERQSIRRLTSRDAYSRFVVRELVNHIQTRYVLIVQWDGFITDPTRWDPRFLDYDYIGARVRWPGLEPRVGNGGFSLRSQRLLQALADPELEFPPGELEDAWICVRNRPLLEQRHGIRFAPDDLADQFSHDHMPATHATFGFHALPNMLRHLGQPELLALIDQLAPETLLQDFGRLLFRSLNLPKPDLFFQLFRRISPHMDPHTLERLVRTCLRDDPLASNLLQIARFLQAR